MIARASSIGLSTGVLLAAFVGVACPGSLESPERFAPVATGGAGGDGGGGATCPDVPRLLVTKCQECHAAQIFIAGQPYPPFAGLDLVSPGVADRVLRVESIGCRTTDCNERPENNECGECERHCGVLADPDDPTGSMIYDKLLERPDCGAQMPRNYDALSGTERACVAQWIASLGSEGSGGTGGTGGGGGTGGSGGTGGTP